MKTTWQTFNFVRCGSILVSTLRLARSRELVSRAHYDSRKSRMEVHADSKGFQPSRRESSHCHIQMTDVAVDAAHHMFAFQRKPAYSVQRCEHDQVWPNGD
jgi:hypothetical protein